MKIKKKTIIFFLLVTILFSSCSNLSDQDVQKYWWKYGSNYHIGDALRFEAGSAYYLNGDTICKNKKPVAIIISCDKSIFSDTYVLKICSFSDRNKTGIYHQKGM